MTKLANNNQTKIEPLKYKPLRFRLIKYGAFFGIIGTIFLTIQPWFITELIKSQAQIKEGLPLYKIWKKLPFPIRTKFYIFDVINPEMAKRGQKIQVRQLGPFVMEQWRGKDVISWNEKNDTVKYWEYKFFKYLENESNGSFDQEITIINPVLSSIGSLIGERLSRLVPIPIVLSPFIYSALSALLMAHDEDIFIKSTPRKLIMGYKVNLLETFTTVIKPFELIGIKSSKLIPTENLLNNSFGILNGKNATPLGPWEVFTGKSFSTAKVFEAISFKNQSVLKKWSSLECNKVQGTDGQRFPPFITRKNKLKVFASDICRHLILRYSHDVSYHGIPAFKFKIAPEVWQPPSFNPNNECYCVQKNNPEHCENPYLLDVSGCFNGAPFMISLPHFLNAPEKITNNVGGLSPNSKEHDFYIVIKPDFGVTISARARIQLNVRVKRVSFLRGFSNIRNSIVPLFWYEEGADLDPILTILLKYGLIYFPNFTLIMFYIFSIGGWLAFASGVGYILLREVSITFHDE